MSRLFFALWPDETVSGKITSICDRLPPGCGRKVQSGNVHITLVFLGDIDETSLGCLLAGVETVPMEPFTLVLDRPGWWRKSQVLWIAPATVPETLQALYEQLASLASGCGIATERRPYSPHMTLARKVFRKPRLPEFEPVIWDVRQFSLMRAETLPSGARYEPVWRSS